MKRIFLALALLLFPIAANASCTGTFAANTACATVAGGVPGPVPFTSVLGGLSIGTTPITGGTNKGLLYDNAGLLGNLATANSGILITDSSGIPSISSTLPSTLSIPSPSITGTPTAPTAALGTNTTQLATTAFVQANILATCQTLGAFIVGTGSTSQCSNTASSQAYINGKLGVGAAIPAAIVDFEAANTVYFNPFGPNPVLLQLAHGSNATPITSISPTIAISRNEATTADTQGGQNAALLINLKSNNNMSVGPIVPQGNALTVNASQSGTGGVAAGYFIATSSGGIFSGLHGGAFGLFAIAQTTGAGNSAISFNGVVQNNSGTDCAYATVVPGGTTCAEIGIFLQAQGANLHSAGIMLYNNAGQFDCGYCVYTGAVKTTAFKSDGFAVDATGKVGIGAATPSKDISFGGQTAYTIWSERELTAATIGQNLTMQAGGAVSGGSNLTGGNLLLSAGIGTGTAGGTGQSNSAVVILAPNLAAGSGTADNTPTEIARFYNSNAFGTLCFGGSAAACSGTLFSFQGTSSFTLFNVPNSGGQMQFQVGGTLRASLQTGSFNVSATPLTLTFGTPTIGSGACGTGANGTIAGSNQTGLITIGAVATTTCTVSFSAALTQAPQACNITPANATAAATGTTVARVSSISTSTWVITGSALASANYYYHCI